MQIDFLELIQLVENYQPMKDWGFTLSTKQEGDPESWLVYTSQWCKIKIHHRRDFHQQMREDSLTIYYGRIHALDDSPTMEHEGQMYFCWFSPDELAYSFLDGKSPEEAFKSRFDTPQFLRDLFARAKESENKVPRLPGESHLRFQKAIWDQYGLRFFELLDIRRPDLWDGYINFLKEYAKLEYAEEEEDAKKMKQVFKIPEIPLYNLI
jgi:hypothetical protein